MSSALSCWCGTDVILLRPNCRTDVCSRVRVSACADTSPLTRACADLRVEHGATHEPQATVLFHDSSIDCSNAWRRRRRRRVFHVQELRGRLSAEPESAKQDKRPRHARLGNGLSAHDFPRHVGLSQMCRVLGQRRASAHCPACRSEPTTLSPDQVRPFGPALPGRPALRCSRSLALGQSPGTTCEYCALAHGMMSRCCVSNCPFPLQQPVTDKCVLAMSPRGMRSQRATPNEIPGRLKLMTSSRTPAIRGITSAKDGEKLDSMRSAVSSAD